MQINQDLQDVGGQVMIVIDLSLQYQGLILLWGGVGRIFELGWVCPETERFETWTADKSETCGQDARSSVENVAEFVFNTLSQCQVHMFYA